VAAAKVCLFVAKLNASTGAVIAAGKPFTSKTLDAAAATAGYGPQKNLGPYKVPWESTPDSYRDELLGAFASGNEPMTATAIRAALPATNRLSGFMDEWLERERRLRGRTEFQRAEIRSQVVRSEAAHRVRPHLGRLLRALTIHQAKNREFEQVVVLWSYAVPGDAELRRRWLYNAITRAQKSATVIVQGENQLREPPFA
jgi:hypothetical protein